jgi:branched-chain amino acid aminotransferase group I
MNELLVYLNGELVRRGEAKVSVWDAGFQCGDGVYEGLRVYRGGVFQLHEHVDRLFSCAHAVGIPMPWSRNHVANAILETIRANGLAEDAHVRVSVTRGDRPWTGMDPRIGEGYPPTIVIIAEPKKPGMPKAGIRLITSSLRRIPAQCMDPKLHTMNQLGQILAKMEANHANVDEALMLDMQGFVAETNHANIFLLRNGRLATPRRDSIMPGFTRGLILDVAPTLGFPVSEENLSVADFYMADEVFITGTVNQLVPVIEIDGRAIGSGAAGMVTTRLLEKYLSVAAAESVTDVMSTLDT